MRDLGEAMDGDDERLGETDALLPQGAAGRAVSGQAQGAAPDGRSQPFSQVVTEQEGAAVVTQVPARTHDVVRRSPSLARISRLL